MANLAPWLALAGAGALHGLNPATACLLAAGCGWRALLPLAAGHAVSVALVAMAAALGLGVAPGWLLWTAGGLGLLLVFVLRRVAAGLAVWSFTMSTLQGAGMMLAPALAPLCLSGSPAREITASGSLALALAAVAVHGAAMLLATAVLGTGVRRGWRATACFRRAAERCAAARA